MAKMHIALRVNNRQVETLAEPRMLWGARALWGS